MFESAWQSMKADKHRFCGTAATLCAMAGIVLIPSILNGFPFLFDDSASYLHTSKYRLTPLDRPIFYGLFLRLVHWKLSPWPVAIVQALLSVFVVREFARTFFGIFSRAKLLVLAALLMLSTSLPWFAANIMPDIYTSLMILALGLLTLGWSSLSRT